MQISVYHLTRQLLGATSLLEQREGAHGDHIHVPQQEEAAKLVNVATDTELQKLLEVPAGQAPSLKDGVRVVRHARLAQAGDHGVLKEAHNVARECAERITVALCDYIDGPGPDVFVETTHRLSHDASRVQRQPDDIHRIGLPGIATRHQPGIATRHQHDQHDQHSHDATQPRPRAPWRHGHTCTLMRRWRILWVLGVVACYPPCQSWCKPTASEGTRHVEPRP
eukprot:scaffold82847_cov71-Phaeocystis_antarctica.AAC.3